MSIEELLSVELDENAEGGSDIVIVPAGIDEALKEPVSSPTDELRPK